MADSICGPSNPLQNFQKKATADRSLQQDRLASRNGPSQGFRSSSAPNAGLLDPEFEAFQAGLPPETAQPAFLRPGEGLHPRPPTNWASDFQQMHITPPPSMQSHQHVPISRTPWHLEYQNQQSQSSQSSQHYQQPSFQPQSQYHQPRFASSLATPSFAMPSFHNQQFQHSPANDIQQQSEEGSRAEAEAFEREFEALTTALLREAELEQLAGNSTELGQDVLLGGSSAQHGLDPAKSDAIPQDLFDPQDYMVDIHDVREAPRNTQETQEPPPTTDDDLARTAGELLERVADNNSAKFRESNFLSLMTQLRDREARVEGNQIVPVSKNENETASSIETKEMLEPSTTRRSSSVPRRRNGLLDPTDTATMAGALPSRPRELAQLKNDISERYRKEFLDTLPARHVVDDF